MRLAEYLQTERGLCVRVAARVGIAPAYLSQIASGTRTAHPALAREIEAECHAVGVRRWDLRPDDWHRIWPELIGADGAPPIPEPAREVA
jgi:DNA-binding transcriptional regulator YdaS (Cro superfamily)